MTKLEFLLSLNKKLSHLPAKDVEERLNFYCEMIEDRTEEGLSEEEAVAAIGTVEEIAVNIEAELGNAPQNNIAIPSKKLGTGEILLLILGSPIWLSLLISAIAVLASLYISLWAIILSLWASFVACIGCSFGGIVSGIIFCIFDNIAAGIFVIAVSLICAGIGIFLFFLCKFATRLTIISSKKLFAYIKIIFERSKA